MSKSHDRRNVDLATIFENSQNINKNTTLTKNHPNLFFMFQIINCYHKYMKLALLLGFFSILISFTALKYHKEQLSQKEQVINTLAEQNTIKSTTLDELTQTLASTSATLSSTSAEFETLKNIDQVQKNNLLDSEVKNIKTLFKQVVAVYENLIRLREKTSKTGPQDTAFTKGLNYVSSFNYASASATFKSLQTDIDKKEAEIAATFKIPDTAKESNTAPTSGSSSQKVTLDNGSQYLVNILAADLKTTKVLVDTASSGDCKTDCPVLPLGTFASRSGAFAAINGPYFCPSTYPSCADKKNSFDTLMMNKNKTYFNSDNNVYSSVPAAIFSSSARFVERSSDWGRDTGVDSVIAGQPLLVSGGKARFAGDGDDKKTGKGTRAFIGATGDTVYIGLVYNASVADMSQVLAKLGIKNAINLDSGGSTAFWSAGRYLAGPGRDLPFGIVLVRR